MNKDRIKTEDKKAMKGFIVIILISGLFGGILGGLSAFADNFAVITSLDVIVSEFIVSMSPYIILIVLVISSIIIITLYSKSRKLYRELEDEDEENFEKIEKNICIALMTTNIQTVLTLLFGVAGYDKIFELEEETMIFRTIFLLSIFILSCTFLIIAQQKLVNFEKEINPEKRGSVFDSKFQEKWVNSCDEAEKAVIYESSFKAYKATNVTCIVMWLICFFMNMIWNVGILPVFMVSAIWLVLVVSYSITAMKLTYGKK